MEAPQPNMAQTSNNRRVWFAFAGHLPGEFSMECTVGGENWAAVRKRIGDLLGVPFRQQLLWSFYRPGSKIDGNLPFSPRDGDHRIEVWNTIDLSDLASGDSIDIVIYIRNLPQMVMKKRVSHEFPAGLPYHPPKAGRLVNSVGSSWDYQVSEDLIKTLRYEVGQHYHWFTSGFIDKMTIPLYFLLSSSGTGKSRNASELHTTVLKCFDGTYGERNEPLTEALKESFVFHISLEKDQAPRSNEKNGMDIIGFRMLHQVIGDSISLDELVETWDPPLPVELLQAVERGNSSQDFGGRPRTVFLIVDGLQVIKDLFGEMGLDSTLGGLGNLAQNGDGLRIVCATSTISGPFEKVQPFWRRRRVFLPCSLIKPPTIKGVPVFRAATLLERMLAEDCGGHGRALEVMSSVLQNSRQDPNFDVTSKVVEHIMETYGNFRPSPTDGAAIFKAIMANRPLPRDENIPGTEITPDELCRKGLVTFEVNIPFWWKIGYLRVPYVWVLVFARRFRDGQFLEELELMDYRDFQALDNSMIANSFSLDNFEKVMIKIWKLKSQSYHEGERVSVKYFHRGGAMDFETGEIELPNFELTDDEIFPQINTMATQRNMIKWSLVTTNSGEVDISKERKNAACSSDIFILFCPGTIPSLESGGTSKIPPRSIVVTKKNWEAYFGPFAGRAYILATQSNPVEGRTC